ncbi:hypothetical protein Dsin_015204 [Dipteronia sinensis]|uniref:Uncharacterized protein n=1 Tax=Dipteronia sinensis TaxID=43782 RepID=A0AAE0ABJ6_9ROSI|nr:hypothetical protein Dsin_015204 [Dipteronia sinensis]
MDEESKRQRQENDVVESFSAAKRQRDGDEKEDVIMDWLSMDDDDTVGTDDELMNLLDSTDASTVSHFTRVKFIDNPYSSTLVFQSSSSYVTINGNEESCGSSFSDSDSSVMASVDRGGMVNVAGVEGWLKELEGSAWGSDEIEASGWIVDEEQEDATTCTGTGGALKGGVMVGWDGSDLDDYVLERFLGEEAAF